MPDRRDRDKYLKYKAKYLRLKSRLQPQHQDAGNCNGEECPARRIRDRSRWSPSDIDFITELNAVVDEDHGGCCGPRTDNPVEFQNSIGDFFENLAVSQRLQERGSFLVNDSSLVVCSPVESITDSTVKCDDGEMVEREKTASDRICEPLPAERGAWRVYLVDWQDHWTEWGDHQPEWEGATLAMQEGPFDGLDRLQWFVTVASIHSQVGIFSAKTFGDIASLPRDMRNRSKKIFVEREREEAERMMRWRRSMGRRVSRSPSPIRPHTWLDVLTNMSLEDKVVVLPHGVAYTTPEMRGRTYLYGVDDADKVVAVFFPSLH